MQFKSLILLALSAPLPAAAFGNLDCIAIESCGNGGCGPTTDPFAVDFDWEGDAATVTFDDQSSVLPLGSRGENNTTVVFEYGSMEDTKRLLRVETSGTDITAFYTFPHSGVTTWVGTCDVRQAA